MIKNIEKSWPFVSILLILVILASLFFWPAANAALAGAALVLSLGMAIVFIVRRRLQSRREGHSDRRGLVRGLGLDLAGLALTLLATLLAAGKAAAYVGGIAGSAAESAWPGTGIVLGILSGLLAAVLTGMVVGFLVQRLWGLLTHPRRSLPPVSNRSG